MLTVKWYKTDTLGDSCTVSGITARTASKYYEEHSYACGWLPPRYPVPAIRYRCYWTRTRFNNMWLVIRQQMSCSLWFAVRCWMNTKQTDKWPR